MYYNLNESTVIEPLLQLSRMVDHVLSEGGRTAGPVPVAAALERRSAGSWLKYFQLSHLNSIHLGFPVILSDSPSQRATCGWLFLGL